MNGRLGKSQSTKRVSPLSEGHHLTQVILQVLDGTACVCVCVVCVCVCVCVCVSVCVCVCVSVCVCVCVCVLCMHVSCVCVMCCVSDNHVSIKCVFLSTWKMFDQTHTVIMLYMYIYSETSILGQEKIRGYWDLRN